jgi:outer membrane protein insertion porin family
MVVRAPAIAFSFAAFALACWADCPDNPKPTIAPLSQPSTVAVRELHLVNVLHATVDEQQQIAKAPVGVCFQTGDTVELSERIRDEFEQRGFFKVKVSSIDISALDHSATPPTVSVTARVDEGDRYRLAVITFTGNKAVSNDAALRKLFPIKDGTWFNIEQAREGIRNLKDVYGELGFINFTPVPDFTFDEQKKLIAMKIDIDEGKQYSIASFQVRGADPNREAALKSAWAELFPSHFPSRTIYNVRLVERYFDRIKDLLPLGAAPDRNLLVQQDNENATVEIILVVAK